MAAPTNQRALKVSDPGFGTIAREPSTFASLSFRSGEHEGTVWNVSRMGYCGWPHKGKPLCAVLMRSTNVCPISTVFGPVPVLVVGLRYPQLSPPYGTKRFLGVPSSGTKIVPWFGTVRKSNRNLIFPWVIYSRILAAIFNWNAVARKILEASSSIIAAIWITILGAI